MELDGRWVAAPADDGIRRDAVGLDYDDHDWHAVAVPGHWRNSAEFVDSDGPLLYRHRFHLDPPGPGQRRFVTLEGVLYQADVWLDGAYLGDPEGYFSPHTFDITPLARLASEHVLAVEITCPPTGADRRALTGALLDPAVAGEEWNPGGLWRPVRIESSGPARIDRLRVLCRDANDARAHVRLHARIDLDRSRPVQIRTCIDGRTVADHGKTLATGANEVAWDVDVVEPHLWWPWSLGDQPLTTVTVEVLVDDELSDIRHVRTGLREVAMDDWTVTVNGERLFVKGANVVPTGRALADAAADDVRRVVSTARDAGLDLLRVQGHVARHELYEAADELGVLLWQDMPLQHVYGRTIRRSAVRQARDAVDLLGHHPSIVVWCAHDDPSPRAAQRRPVTGADADLTGATSRRTVFERLAREQLPTWNRSILDLWVKRALEAADETRPVIAHSGVAPHLPQLDGTDSHLWFGWQYGEYTDLAAFAAAMPRMVRFVGAFGAASAASDEAEPRRGTLVDDQRARLELRIPPRGFDDHRAWCDATQRYQAELLRHHIETLRRLKYRPTGGFCLSTWNDARPGVSTGVIDHAMRPKAALRTVVDACRPVIVVADTMPSTLRPGDASALDVHVVSDLRRPLDDLCCTALLRWAGGEHSWSWRGSVPPDACVRVGTVQFLVPDVDGELWLDLTVEHPDVAATNRYVAVVRRNAE